MSWRQGIRDALIVFLMTLAVVLALAIVAGHVGSTGP